MGGHVSKSDFAKIYRCKPSYVTKSIKEKKIVLSEDGKKVNVEASLRLIEATGDPSKQGVRDRWNAYRGGKSIDSSAGQQSCADAPPPPTSRSSHSDSAAREHPSAPSNKGFVPFAMVLAQLHLSSAECDAYLPTG